MHLVFRLITDGQYYLLPVKEYENIRTDKILLGYYDDDYIYIVPDVVVRKGNLMLNAVMDTIRLSLMRGEKIEIGGFGTFEVLTDLKGERIPVFKGESQVLA